MARWDVHIRDTIWTYILPISILAIGIFMFMTDRIQVIRQWYGAKYLKKFSELHEEIIEPIKKALFADLSDIDSNLIDLRNKGLIRILEIGVGSGSNLKYYPQQCRLVVVDPSPHFQNYFRDNIDRFPDINLEKFVVSPGERLRGIPSNSVDLVVTTTMLCCVEHVPKVLKEIKRVLVPVCVSIRVAIFISWNTFWLRRTQNFGNSKEWRIVLASGNGFMIDADLDKLILIL